MRIIRREWKRASVWFGWLIRIRVEVELLDCRDMNKRIWS